MKNIFEKIRNKRIITIFTLACLAACLVIEPANRIWNKAPFSFEMAAIHTLIGGTVVSIFLFGV